MGLSSSSFLAGPSVEPGMLSCIKELHNYVKINLIVRHDSLLSKTKNKLSTNGIDINKIDFIIYGGRGACTIRDCGPAFLVDKNERITAVDFEYISVFPGTSESTRLLFPSRVSPPSY